MLLTCSISFNHIFMINSKILLKTLQAKLLCNSLHLKLNMSSSNPITMIEFHSSQRFFRSQLLAHLNKTQVLYNRKDLNGVGWYFSNVNVHKSPRIL